MTDNKRVTDLISTNNELRKKLNPANEEYYSKLLIYVRTSGLLYDDYEVESSLLEILQDIIEAQDNGLAADEYFGSTPDITANQLIANFTKISFWQRFKFFGTLFGISIIWTALFQLTSHDHQFNIIPYILNGIFLTAFIYGVFWFIHQTTYWKISINKITKFLFSWIISMLVIAIFAGIQFAKPTFLNIPITSTFIVGFNIILLVASLLVLLLIKKTSRPIIIAVSPIIWIITITNILKIYSPMNVATSLTLWSFILTILGSVWFLICLWWNTRKADR